MAVAAISMMSYAQNYTLKGDVMELLKERLEGQVIYITNPHSNRQVDSAKVVNGRFEFKGTATGDSICYVGFLANRAHFILQSGDIVYDGKKNTFSGTPLNEILSQYQDEVSAIRRDISQQSQQISQDSSLDDEEKIANARRLYREYDQRSSIVARKYIMANKDNALNALFIEQWLNHGDDVKRYDEAMSMAGNYAKSYRPLVKDKPRMEALRKVQVGMPFVDFTVPKGNLDGTDVKFSDHVGKGKWVLVDFWASWCGPCRAEIPNIKEAYNKYHGDKFDVLSIAVWDQHPRTMKALEEEKMPWNQIIDADKIPTDAYGINGIPQIILFAPDGTIAARNLRGENVDQTIHKFLNQTAVITGAVKGAADGDTILLLENGNFMEKETNRLLATTTVKDGRFRFDYDCDGKVRVGFVSGKGISCGLIIEPGNITVTQVDEKKFIATGTRQNELLLSYNHKNDSLNALVNEAMQKVDMSDYNTYLKQTKEIRAPYLKPMKQMCEKFIEENMGTAIAEYVLYFYGMSNPKEAVAYLEELDQDTYTYRPLIGFAKKLRTSSGFNIGEKFRDFTINDGNADGTKVSLSDYVGRGKVVLVDFWASWCGWCRRETPNLKAVYEKYKDKNFTVLGLAIQDKKEATLKAINEDKPTWPQIFNCDDIPTKLYGINGIPQIMLFDADGNLLARDLRGEDIMKAVDNAMNE